MWGKILQFSWGPCIWWDRASSGRTRYTFSLPIRSNLESFFLLVSTGEDCENHYLSSAQSCNCRSRWVLVVQQSFGLRENSDQRSRLTLGPHRCLSDVSFPVSDEISMGIPQTLFPPLRQAPCIHYGLSRLTPLYGLA